MICNSSPIILPFIVYGLILRLVDFLHPGKKNRQSQFIKYAYVSYWIVGVLPAALLGTSLLTSFYYTLDQLESNSIVYGWALDYLFASLLIVFMYIPLGFYANNGHFIRTLCFFPFSFVTLPIALYFHRNYNMVVNGPRCLTKSRLLFLFVLLTCYHLYLWIPGVISWSNSHCWRDESFSLVIDTYEGKLIALIVTLQFVTLNTYVWTTYKNIVYCFILTYIIGNNVTIGVTLLAIDLIINRIQ